MILCDACGHPITDATCKGNSWGLPVHHACWEAVEQEVDKRLATDRQAHEQEREQEEAGRDGR